MKMEELKEGQSVVTGDSYGYDLVIVVEPLHASDEYGFPVVTVRYDNNDEKDLGGIPGYEPNFYTVDEYLSWHAPECRHDALRELLT